MKQKDPYKAFAAFAEAAKTDPKNRKYQKTLAEAGRQASIGCLQQAKDKIASNPKTAMDLLQRSADYDPGNTEAAGLLAVLQTQVRSIQEKVSVARTNLSTYNADSANLIAREYAPFRELVPELELLERELALADRLRQAQAFFDSGDLTSAAEALAWVPTYRLESPRLTDASKNVRTSIIQRAEAALVSGSDHTLASIRSQTQALSVLQKVNVESSSLRAHRIRLSSMLTNLAMFPTGSNAPSLGEHPRVLVQAISALTRNTLLDDEGQQLVKKHQAQNPAPVRLRLSVGRLEKCFSTINAEWFRQAVANTDDKVHLVEGDDYDVHLMIGAVDCVEGENPRASARVVNSTYVSGQSQIVNPRYVQLRAELERVSAVLAEADGDQVNFMISFLRGRRIALQRQLSETPPFL